MRYFQSKKILALCAIIIGAALVAVLAHTKSGPETQTRDAVSLYNDVGTAATPEDVGNLALTAGFSGKDLPPGNGTAAQGAELFAGRCAMCHGANLEGVHWIPEEFSPIHGPRLGGGNSTPVYYGAPNQITTLAYAAPSAMVIFDTIAVEMPMFRAGTLKPDQIYSLTAFILFKNGIIKEDQVMNRATLPEVQMPNRNSFPASDAVYMNMKKRDCYKTYGVCTGE